MLRTGKSGLVASVAIAAAALLLAVGCSDDVNNITIPPDTSGEVDITLTAQVISYPSGAPVAGASYKALGTDHSGVTDADGYFTVSGMTRGAYLFEVDDADHLATRMSAYFANLEKTQSWHLQETIYLMEPIGELQLQVLRAEDGEPLAGAPITLVNAAVSDMSSSQYLADPRALVFPVTDADGRALLTGLPIGELYFSVGGVDVDDDGTEDYAARSVTVYVRSGRTNTAGVALSPPSSGGTVSLISTNMPSYGGSLYAGSVYYVFSDSMATEVDAWSASMAMDNSPYSQIPLTGTWTSPMRLEVRPMQVLSDASMDYDFSVTAMSRSGQVYQATSRFYWRQPADVGSGDCEEIVADLHLAEGGGIDFNTRSLNLAWTAVPCAGGYNVYARDDRNNPGWTYLVHNPVDYESGLIEQSVGLPSSFDRYAVDGFQTPFAGTTVSICVVPDAAVDPTPGDAHAVLLLADVTPPAFLSSGATGMFDNATDVDQRCMIEIAFSEYLDSSTPAPVLEVREAGGDPDFVIDASAAQWTWSPGMASGYFTVIVPPTSNGLLDEYRVVLAGATDLSGNAPFEDIVSDWETFLPLPPVWDFEEGQQDWTCSDGYWEWGAPQDGPYSGYQSSFCWATNLDGYYDYNWDTRLVSPQFMVPLSAPQVSYQVYADTYTGDYFEVILEVAGVEHLLSTETMDYTSWRREIVPLTDYAGQTGRLVFRFISNSVSNDSGIFIDNVAVSGE